MYKKTNIIIHICINIAELLHSGTTTEAMYDNEIPARVGGRRVEVIKPKMN